MPVATFCVVVVNCKIKVNKWHSLRQKRDKSCYKYLCCCWQCWWFLMGDMHEQERQWRNGGGEIMSLSSSLF